MRQLFDGLAFGIIFMVLYALLFAWPFMYLWNISVPYMFNLTTLSYQNAVIIILLYKLLNMKLIIPKVRVTKNGNSI